MDNQKEQSGEVRAFEKHTSGPWGYVDGMIVSPTGRMVADFVPREYDGSLIAASPDLYDACREFVRKCECGEARSKRSYAQMTAAIAKAEGRA